MPVEERRGQLDHPFEPSDAHVLIVDDDPASRILLENVVSRHYRATLVDSGEAALRILAAREFDVILLDIMMPGMNGLEVLKLLRENETTSNLPVILVSALADSQDVVRGLQMGASDYVTKPIDVNVILARLKTQLTLKQLVDEREHMIVELQNLEEIRNRLFRVASHDLKNPLANIRMAEFVLRDAINGDELASQVMDTVMLSVDAMQEVINDFMDVVVMKSGHLEMRMEAVEMEPLVCNIVMQYSLAAGSKDIEVDLGELTGQVWADPARLTQVVGNLVSNAIKYSPQRTRVAVWLDSSGPETMRLNVADQGPGIPAGERHLLFTEFGKLTPRPTGQENSTGLGLWIVKSLVNMMGGAVGVDFPPDGGTVFWIELATPPLDA
jgi:signal transduction histidine kinase